MRRATGVMAALATIAALAACGGASGTSASSAGSTTSATAVVDQYSALAAKLNSDRTALNAKLTKDETAGDLPAVSADIKLAAQQYQSALDGLEKIPFPATMQAHVKDVVAAFNAIIAALTTAATATTVDDLNAKVAAVTTAAATVQTAVTVLRADLGLPPTSG